MKKLLTITSIFFAFNSFGQNFYFPKENYKDSITLGKYMPVLAKQVIAVYKEENRKIDFEDLCDLQIVAEQYEEANISLDSFRRFTKLHSSDTVSIKAMSFGDQSFVLTKLRQAKNHISFTDAYTFTFNTLFNAFPPQAIPVAESGIDNEYAFLKGEHDNLYKLLNSQKGKDSISFDDAKKLCLAYSWYNVDSQITPLTKPLFAAWENKRFIIEDSVLIKTRDGATISAVVVRKRGLVVKQPAIFIFNIYISPVDKNKARYWADNGYVGVVVNTRGKGLSPQDIEPFEHDANDAYDIIDWISKQAWSNGKVGMVGGSYLGFDQWAAVKKVHPALKTIIPQVAVGPGIDYPMLNNVFMSYMLRWIHYVTNSKNTDEDDFNNEEHWDSTFKKWYVSGKSFRSLDTIEGRPNKIFQRRLMHPGYDAYWQSMVPYKTDFSKINIPVLTITGYYDGDQSGAIYYFKQHYLYNKNADHYLVIGPYDHYGPQSEAPSSKLMGYTIDSVANINLYDLVDQWFNYVLKDSTRPALLKDKINYEVMGANEWKHVPALSKMNNDTLNFYLSNVRVAQHYKLNTLPSSTLEFIRQEVDFKD
ncbi:MAG: CocE/NonD family hydrolase, partial [Chitinophagaceae bacterium]